MINVGLAQIADATPVVEVADGAHGGPVNDHARFLIETDGPLSVQHVSDADMLTRFEPIITNEPDFGYIPDGIWLSLAVRNVSNTPLRRYLLMHTNFMSEISVWWATEDGADLVLQQDRTSDFGSRPVPYSELIAPFTIEGSEAGTLFIRYASNGDTALPLSLLDEVGLASAVNARLVVDFAFYGLMVMVILASLLFRLMFRSSVFVAYAIYVTSVLMLIFQRDGYAFQYLWPDAPVWNNFSSLPLGAGLPLFAAIFTRTYLQTRRLHPQIDKMLIAVAVLQVAVVMSSAIIGAAQAKQLALMSVSVAIVVFISIGIMAYRQYGNRALFFLIGWLGLLAGTVVMTVIHWTEVDITRAQSLHIMRVAMVFDALMMGLASIFQVVDLQRDRERLDRERIEMLDANLRLHERFARMEHSYQMAQALAQMRGEAVSDLTHDLRQPIFVLRAAINQLPSDGRGKRTHIDIKNAINYLEELVDTTLHDALEAEKGSDAQGFAVEIIEINRLFAAMRSMFLNEAERNSVDLRIVETSALTTATPFAVLRILSNFVSNAIRYAPGARTLVGVRRRKNAWSIEVHDAGPGLTQEALRKVMARCARVEDELGEGHGLGLSIVAKLAKHQGLEWCFDSHPGRGTVAKLHVPVTCAILQESQDN